MTTTRSGYGHRLLAAMERARTITSSTVPVAVRRDEIIRLCLQGFTVPQMRALYVAHFSGAPLARGLKRAEVAEALRTKILTSLEG